MSGLLCDVQVYASDGITKHNLIGCTLHFAIRILAFAIDGGGGIAKSSLNFTHTPPAPTLSPSHALAPASSLGEGAKRMVFCYLLHMIIMCVCVHVIIQI